MQSKIARIPFHTLLFAAFPSLALLAFNIAELELSDGYRSLLLSLLVSGLALVVGRLLLGDWLRPAVLVSLSFIFFFSYGHLYNYLKAVQIGGIVLGRHRYLLPLGVLVLGVIFFSVLRRRISIIRLTELMNVLGVFLIAISLWQVVSFEIRASSSSLNGNATSQTELYGISSSPENNAPDVYYIVLDGYARDDVLRDVVEFENSTFISKMESLGFYFPKCSRSNYTLTQLSLTSSMNFSYIKNLGLGLEREALLDRADFDTTIRKDSRVLKIFEELGYTTVAFETGFRWTEITGADYFYAPHQTWLDTLRSGNGLNDFEGLLLRSSLATLLFEDDFVPAEGDINAGIVSSGERAHFELVNFVLETLPQTPHLPGNKFVFAHLVVPHEPYVFAADGSFAPTEDVIQGYRNQIEFINSEILRIMGEILGESEQPPIIIVHADHGGPYIDVPSRVFTTAAYYFPNGEDFELYEYLTPVNIFRYVFNRYFGANLDILENRSHYSTYLLPYSFDIVEEQRAECLP